MAFMKRAAATGLALVLVAGILAGVHELVHAVHPRNGMIARAGSKLPSSRFEAATTMRSVGSPLRAECWAFAKPSNPFNSAPTPAIFADDQSENRPPACRQTGEIQQAARESPPPLMPLPPSTNAVPLPPPGDDLPFADEPAKQKPSARKPAPTNSRQLDSSGRRLIDKELPDSSVEERDLWHETMKDVPLNDLRELLRLRTQLGRLSPRLLENRRPASQPPLLPPGPHPIESGPLHSAPSDATAPPVVEPDAGHVIRESLAAIQRARRLIVHNIANAQTVGFKRQLISFESVPDSAGTPGSVEAPAVRDMAPGRLFRTDRDLDLAIEGEGFFHVADVQNKRDAYTRRGRFTTNAGSQLVLETLGGDWLLQPPITIPPATARIEIGGDGQVRGWDTRSRSFIQLGNIQTACFASAGRLVDIKGVLFTATAVMAADPQSPGTSGHGLLRQGCLEESNVDVKQELEELARLAGQSQALEQAARMLQPLVFDRPLVPFDASWLTPGNAFPASQDAPK
jgi:flagellar basal-body rod protein FlgG